MRYEMFCLDLFFSLVGAPHTDISGAELDCFFMKIT